VQELGKEENDKKKDRKRRFLKKICTELKEAASCLKLNI
jgi:hypothetical protein